MCKGGGYPKMFMPAHHPFRGRFLQPGTHRSTEMGGPPKMFRYSFQGYIALAKTTKTEELRISDIIHYLLFTVNLPSLRIVVWILSDSSKSKSPLYTVIIDFPEISVIVKTVLTTSSGRVSDFREYLTNSIITLSAACPFATNCPQKQHFKPKKWIKD